MHDPLAPEGCGAGTVHLYEVAEEAAGYFHDETVRPLIGQVDDYPEQEIEDAVDAYCRYAGIDDV